MRKYKTLKTDDLDEVEKVLSQSHADYPKTFKIEDATPVYTEGHIVWAVLYSYDKDEEKKVPLHSALREP